MRLLELRIEPNGRAGWGSECLLFGDEITQLYGPNGCGKTPILHSVAYALGYPVRFREDIVSNCEFVILKAIHNKNLVFFKRRFGNAFDVQCVIENVDETKTFYNEKDMSEFLFELLGIPTSTLISTGNEPVVPYISTFLPLFYVAQDSGYSAAYKAPATFIRDQYAEMVRLCLEVPAKNTYEGKKLLIEKRASLEGVNIAIVQKEKFIEHLMDQQNGVSRPLKEIDEHLRRITSELEQLRSNQDASFGIESAAEEVINSKVIENKNLALQIRELEARTSGFAKISNEIEIEINTLSLNEEARRLFSSFRDICANPACQLFLRSSDSYGKSLLYLRDQLKDLERNKRCQEIRLEELRGRYAKGCEEIEALKVRFSAKKEMLGADTLVRAISELMRTLFDLQKERDLTESVESEKAEYVGLLNKRNRLQDDIASIDTGGKSGDLRVLQFRATLRAKLIEWLDVLETKNVSREISIDPDFNIQFGAEKLSQFSGSTLLRIVLAIKAAFFEIYVSGAHPVIEFLILDTPRQHDIESRHFAAFIAKLKIVASSNDAQVVFSTTEYHYSTSGNDAEWVPTFPGEEQKMFLGLVSRDNLFSST